VVAQQRLWDVAEWVGARVELPQQDAKCVHVSGLGEVAFHHDLRTHVRLIRG